MAEQVLPAPTHSNRWSGIASIFGYRNLAIGASLITLVVFTGIFAPWLVPHNPYHQDLSITFQSPSMGHWFGTDEYGRDMLSRVLYGARQVCRSACLRAMSAA
jgi:ABC-type dipeptide/oligopeptide/nickel transport system permease subunit